MNAYVHATDYRLSAKRHYLCCDEYVTEAMAPDAICDPICPCCDHRAPDGRTSHRMGPACFDGSCLVTP